MHQHANLTILSRSIIIDGKEIISTVRICELLRYLALTPGEIVHREVLKAKMYGVRHTSEGSIPTLISMARNLLRGTTLRIVTENQVGYKLVGLKADAKAKELG